MSIEQQVEQTATDALNHSSHLFSRSVSCRFHGGVLRLDGRVPTFYLKQMAQSLLGGIDGVRRIENALVVVNPNGVSSEPAYS
ncbi:BON domain protein [Posidoniimonas corsicana]|uniref:BON domain protein n=1 Tax=Posidoniimonas corsicana TaxID=1938618 RepID=A0A5C5VHN1_9BACT|nr:BON domain-containing protein [Posidoniimonas corsicana]TWT37192.1 BON domain protein [Posidoniimonas corsicana]